MSIIRSVSTFLFLSTCLFAFNVTLCSDMFSECVDINTTLCNLELIQAACPTTCGEWNTSVCLSNSTESCEDFDFGGPIAFIGYGIFFVLLVIIFVLIYSVCVDTIPLKSSIARFSRKKEKIRDVPEEKQGRVGEAELIALNPNRMGVSNSVIDPMQDNLLNNSETGRSNDPEEKMAVAYNKSSYGKSEVEEAEGRYDPDDDFFKHHLIQASTSEMEPPLPPRIGGPRISGALSKKALPNSTRLPMTPKVMHHVNERLANLAVDSSSGNGTMGNVQHQTSVELSLADILSSPEGLDAEGVGSIFSPAESDKEVDMPAGGARPLTDHDCELMFKKPAQTSFSKIEKRENS